MEGCCDNMRIVSSGTPQSGLGQLDIITGVFSFATGLFTKDPQKTEYDRIRQQVLDSIGTLHEEYENTKNAGALTRTFLQHCIDALSELLAGFKKYTDGMLSKYPGDAGWINPRFHDYYDFGMGIKTAWQQELATLPSDYTGGVIDYIQDLFGGGSGPDITLPQFPNTVPYTGAPHTTQVQSAGLGSSTGMLIVGGVVLGLIFMSKRKRG